MNKIFHVFMDTNMIRQHSGLKEIALNRKVDLEKLPSGQHVIFMNKAMNRMKVYSYNGVLSYIFKDKEKIDLNALDEIVNTFSTHGKIDIDRGVKESLLKRLPKLKTAIPLVVKKSQKDTSNTW